MRKVIWSSIFNGNGNLKNLFKFQMGKYPTNKLWKSWCNVMDMICGLALGYD